MTDYLHIAQDRVEVTHYVRQSARQWVVTTYFDLSETVTLAALDVSLTVEQIYSKTQVAPVGDLQ